MAQNREDVPSSGVCSQPREIDRISKDLSPRLVAWSEKIAIFVNINVNSEFWLYHREGGFLFVSTGLNRSQQMRVYPPVLTPDAGSMPFSPIRWPESGHESFGGA